MPYFDNDPFPGTDYSQYLTWNKVVTPDGQVMYEVPNNPGYVFDPILSNATGKKMFRQNPKRQIDEENRRKDFEDEQRKQQEYLNSPLGQLVPVVGSVGGMVAANQLMTPSVTAVNTVPLQGGATGVLMPDGTIKGGTALANAAAQGATGTVTTGATTAVTPQILSASRIPTAPVEASLLGNVGNMAGSLGGMGALAGIAAGTYLGGEAAYDMIKGRKPSLPGRVTLGMATGGLSELANATGLFNHKSTRERQADVTNDIMNKYKDDPQALAYWSAMREQYKDAPPDPSKPFLNGTYGSWDEYKQAGLQAGDLSGVGGNAIFKEWASLSQPQREAVTQALIDADLYDSKDGGVVIKDEKKAQEIKNNVLKGFNVGANATAAAQGAMGV